MIILAVATLIVIIGLFIFGVVSLISMQAARKSAAPFFPTPADGIRKALRAADIKPGEIFYDLGAGNGKALLIAEKEFGARATGFEISIPLYLIAKINLFARGSRSKMLFKNLWNERLSDADVLFVFLAERTMPKIAAKLKAELKPGARFVTYAFRIPGLTPEQVINVHGAWNLFVYKN